MKRRFPDYEEMSGLCVVSLLSKLHQKSKPCAAHRRVRVIILAKCPGGSMVRPSLLGWREYGFDSRHERGLFLRNIGLHRRKRENVMRDGLIPLKHGPAPRRVSNLEYDEMK